MQKAVHAAFPELWTNRSIASDFCWNSELQSKNSKRLSSLTVGSIWKRMFICKKKKSVIFHRAEDAKEESKEKSSTNTFPLCSNRDAPGVGQRETLWAEGACFPSPFQKPKYSSDTLHARTGTEGGHRARLLGKITVLLLGSYPRWAELPRGRRCHRVPVSRVTVQLPVQQTIRNSPNYKQFIPICAFLPRQTVQRWLLLRAKQGSQSDTTSSELFMCCSMGVTPMGREYSGSPPLAMEKHTQLRKQTADTPCSLSDCLTHSHPERKYSAHLRNAWAKKALTKEEKNPPSQIQSENNSRQNAAGYNAQKSAPVSTWSPVFISSSCVTQRQDADKRYSCVVRLKAHIIIKKNS